MLNTTRSKVNINHSHIFFIMCVIYSSSILFMIRTNKYILKNLFLLKEFQKLIIIEMQVRKCFVRHFTPRSNLRKMREEERRKKESFCYYNSFAAHFFFRFLNPFFLRLEHCHFMFSFRQTHTTDEE